MNLREYLNQNFVKEAIVTYAGENTYLSTYSAYEIANNVPFLSQSQYFYLFLHLFSIPLRVEKSRLFGDEVVIGVFLNSVDKLVEAVDNCPTDLLEFVNWHLKELGVATFDIESAEIITFEPCARSFPTALKVKTLGKSVLISGDAHYNSKYILAYPKA